jgi:rhodanese-related sulfurtransferase
LKTTDKPSLQDFHIEGVKHIKPADALEALEKGEAVMIDVREISEITLGNVPLDRVLNHPMSVILERLPYISKDQNIIVACPGGVRSSRVASLLMQHGYQLVASLDGGLKTWKVMGLPYDINSLCDCECDCNCNSEIKTNATILRTKAGNNIPGKVDYKNLKMI